MNGVMLMADTVAADDGEDDADDATRDSHLRSSSGSCMSLGGSVSMRF